MAQSLSTPQVLAQPFAENGDKNVIPTTNDPSTGLASLSAGLPPITSVRIQDGGKAPRRADVNGIVNLISQQHYFFQNGGFYPFRADVCSEIGGYPLNALLLDVGADGSVSFMQSLVQNNTYNYITNPEYIDNVHWKRIDLGKSGLPPLIHTWSDHILNDVSWLRADTFSWQSGLLYVSVYNHLVDDIDGITPVTELVGSYNITYYPCSDGHMIVMPDQEAVVQNIYNESGVAWYYILDTTNHRFKLPRTKYGFTGLRDAVGKYVEPTLPNITGQVANNRIMGNDSSGAFQSLNIGTAYSNDHAAGGGGFSFDASRSSSIYKNGATVQPPATQMYLYFYVGFYARSAIEQTAGVTTEVLDEKTDTDASNLSAAGKSLISGLGMLSDTSESLAIGASGTSYTAPANGWFYFRTAANTEAMLDNITATISVSSQTAYNPSVIMPAKKGDIVGIYYTGGTQVLKFVYAQGEV